MSFDDEFEELAGLAYQAAFRVVGSRSEAEEIAQETMTKAFVRWRRVRRHARPWVCRVAINDALGVVRRRKRPEPEILIPVGDHQEGVVDRLDLRCLLGLLSRRQRDVVGLRYLADMSETDVAAELGISVGTVKMHAHRALSTLRAYTDVSAMQSPTRTGQIGLERKAISDV